MTCLYDANRQWSTRPDDERFDSLQSMRDACKAYAESAVEADCAMEDLRVESSGNEIALVGKTGTPAQLTHHAFGQLARFAGAPADYLRTLPADIASNALNVGLSKRGKATDKGLSLLFHNNSKGLLARAITSESYDRVWNYEVMDRVIKYLGNEGWVVPPARPARPGQKGTRKATPADILPNQGSFGLAVNVGDEIAPAGLYASDHDMFAFLVNMTDPVNDGTKLLNRGVFIQNSEVGDKALKFKLFTFDNVCGNHIVWDVGTVTEVSCRHRKGDEAQRGNTLKNMLYRWHVMSESLPTGDQISQAIQNAKEYEIAATKDEVLDKVFAFAKKKGLVKLGKGILEGGYAIAESTPRYGNPRSVWGLINGLTELSQQTAYADERNDLDVQAGRLMELSA